MMKSIFRTERFIILTMNINIVINEMQVLANFGNVRFYYRVGDQVMRIETFAVFGYSCSVSRKS